MNDLGVVSLANSILGSATGLSMGLLALKASVIMGLGWLAVLALRQASAATRHMVWALAFAGVLILPLASMWMPSWAILPGGSWSEGFVDPGAPATETGVPGMKTAASPAMSRAEARGSGSGVGITAGRASGAVGRASSRAPGSTVIADESVPGPLGAPAAARGGGETPGTGSGRAVDPLVDLSLPRVFTALLMVLWGTGVALRLGVLWSGVGRVSWLARRAEPSTDATVLSEADAVAADLGLSRTPAILIGEEAPVPMTWGVLSPRILLPSQARFWTPGRLHRVLLHETAHIARRDLLAQWIGEIACALHWFNPLVWIAAARMRMEREHASDDLVLSRGVRASDYAEDLLEIVRDFGVPPALAGAAGMARPSQLGERLRAVLDPSRRRGAVGGAVRAAAVTGGLLVLMGAAALGPSVVEVSPESADGFVSPPQADRATESDPAVRMSAVDTDPRAGGGEDSSRALTVDAADRLPAKSPGIPARPLVAALCPYPDEGEEHDPEYGVLITEDGGRVRGTMINSSSDDGMVELAWTGRECTVRVSMPQATRFNDTETDVQSIPRGGEFEAEFRSRTLTRRVVVQSDLTREYHVDGREAVWDTRAREWMADLVVSIFRRTGHQAEERAARILDAGGLEALIREIGLLQSGFVSAEYIGVGYTLVDDDAQRSQLLALAAETIDGDYRLAKVLATAAEATTMSAGLRGEFIRTAGLLEGDYEMGRVFAALLEHQEVDRDGLFQIVEEARENLDGDYEMSRLYQRLLDDPDLDLELARMIVESASRNLDGDYEISQVIRAVAERDDLGSGVVREVMAALPLLDGDHARSEILEDYAALARTPADLSRVVAGMSVLDGDHARGEVLRVVLDSPHFGAETFDAVMGVLHLMGGYQTRGTVTRMVRDYDPSDDQLIELIGLAAGESGFDGSEILTQIARTGRVEGPVREAYLRAAEGFGDHDQDRILAALVRGGEHP